MKTIVQLGRNLDLSITAEGVENAQQLGILRELGCEEAQALACSAVPSTRLSGLKPFAPRERGNFVRVEIGLPVILAPRRSGWQTSHWSSGDRKTPPCRLRSGMPAA